RLTSRINMRRIDIPENKKIATVKVADVEIGKGIKAVHEVLLFDQHGDLGFFCDCREETVPGTNTPICYGILAVGHGIKPIIRSDRTALRDVKNFIRGGGRLMPYIERYLDETQRKADSMPPDDAA